VDPSDGALRKSAGLSGIDCGVRGILTTAAGTCRTAVANSISITIGTLRVADGALSAFNGVVYVQVNDIQASCTKAKELGATVAPGFPFNLPNGTGANGLILDPAGHPLGMYSRTPKRRRSRRICDFGMCR
jgi:hypothetical protein